MENKTLTAILLGLLLVVALMAGVFSMLIWDGAKSEYTGNDFQNDMIESQEDFEASVYGLERDHVRIAGKLDSMYSQIGSTKVYTRHLARLSYINMFLIIAVGFLLLYKND